MIYITNNIIERKKMQPKKVVIVGAGPAGLSAAAEMSKNKNFEVIVLDKNSGPSYKVCGGGIDSKYIKKLVSEDILEHEFSEFFINTARNSFRIGDGKTPFIGTLNRKILNEKLAEKAEDCGAIILFNKAVGKIEEDKVITSSGEEFPYDYLIGADGANSIVRKSLGIQTEKFLIAFQYIIPGSYDKMEFYVDFKKFGVTYTWIFPQKNIISVGTGYAASEKKSQEEIKVLKDNFEAFCHERFNLKDARFEGFSINYDYRGFEFGNVYLAGDAAGLASGLTGEGIKPAILSGQDIARKIQEPDYECVNILKCLKTKKREDGMLHLLIDKPWGKFFTAICSVLIEFTWFKKIFLKIL